MWEQLLSAVLALAVGYLLWQLRRKQQRLEYEVIRSAPFPQTKGVGRYFLVRLENTGNEAIEDLQISIDLGRIAIASTSVDEEDLVDSIEEHETNLTARSSHFNPGEKLTFRVTTRGEADDSDLTVRARGKGVTAKRQDEATESLFLDPQVITLLIAAVGGILGFQTAGFLLDDPRQQVASELQREVSTFTLNLDVLSLTMDVADLAAELRLQRNDYASALWQQISGLEAAIELAEVSQRIRDQADSDASGNMRPHPSVLVQLSQVESLAQLVADSSERGISPSSDAHLRSLLNRIPPEYEGSADRVRQILDRASERP